MIPVITLLLVVMFSILITRIATVALTFTGLSKEIARFQARSAFTGVGYTTNEAEKIVNHPVRRRIVLLLMLFGNAGIVTVIASVVVTFVSFEVVGDSIMIRSLLLLLGLVGLWFASKNKYVEKTLERYIGWMLKKYTNIDVKDYAGILHVAGEYKVVEMYIEDDDWLADKQLQDLGLHKEGFLVLGITRKDGSYIGAPNGSMKMFAGDNAVLYGRASAFDELDKRRKGKSGDIEHERAIIKQKELEESTMREDAAAQQTVINE